MLVKVEMKVISLVSFELAILNVLHSFQEFSKQKLCIKSRILLHVKKGNSYESSGNALHCNRQPALSARLPEPVKASVMLYQIER
jgi:hypothetical protein